MCSGEGHGSFLAKVCHPVPAAISLELIYLGGEVALLIIRLERESDSVLLNQDA